MNTKPDTNHAALATQVKRQVEKKTYIRHRLIETGKQTRNGLWGDKDYYWSSAKVGNSHLALLLGVSP